jgi:hypothetical protein
MSNIYICEREIWGGVQSVGLSESDRCSHTYVVGKTGVGKSTLLRNLLVQEIELGRGVGLIDPHGDLAAEILEHIPARRVDDVVYFNPADVNYPCSVNVLRTGQPPDLVASSVVGALKNIWKDSWGPRLEYILYASVAALAECQNASLLGIPRLLTDPVYRLWVIRQVRDPVVRSFWSREFTAYDKRFRNEAVSPVLNKVGQFLMSPVIRNILGQVKRRIDFRHVLDRKQIFIANLSKADLGEEKTALLGSLLVSQFQMAAMGRARLRPESRVPFNLCIDEFHNFITDSFSGILSESRKYGLFLTLSHQFTEQLRPEVRQAIFGNAGGFISFRVGFSDAELIAKEMGTFRPEQLADLSQFEIAAKLSMNGSQTEPFLGKSLAPLGTHHGRSETIIKRSRERFSSKRSDVEFKVGKWIEKSH